MSEERILERVRKMLALANDLAASEGERDNALRMAHNLLAKHELDMEDVKGFERDKVDPREKHENEGWNLLWCWDVRKAMAKLFFCKYIRGPKINATRGKHYWIGRASAVTTAMYMADWIIAGMLKEADRRYKHRLTPEGRSFCVGCSERLLVRVREMLKAQQEEYKAVGSGLVVIDIAKAEDDANAEMMNATMSIKLVKHRSSKVEQSSYGAGRAHADSINLSKQLANKKGTLGIGNS